MSRAPFCPCCAFRKDDGDAEKRERSLVAAFVFGRMTHALELDRDDVLCDEHAEMAKDAHEHVLAAQRALVKVAF